MNADPIVEQVREARRQIERETEQNPELYYQRLQELQKTLSARLVCRQLKPLPATEGGKAA